MKLYVKVIEIICNDSTINIYQNQNLFENFKNIKGAKNGPLTIENLENFPAQDIAHKWHILAAQNRRS